MDENSQIVELNEMFINVLPSLPTDIENSVYYTKLKHLLFSEIVTFTKEQLELREDLNIFRMNVGAKMTEGEIREYLDGLKAKYNTGDKNVIGIEYTIEVTRIDFGVPVFCVIKRGEEIKMKKFVFRFRKNITDPLEGLTIGGTIDNNQKSTPNSRKEKAKKLLGGGK